MRTRVAFVLFWLVGCVERIDITHVELIDRTKVAIASGDTTILPIGSDRAELPATAYLDSPKRGSTIDRGGNDGHEIFVLCPECSDGGVSIVRGRQLKLYGSASELLHLDGDLMRVHWTPTVYGRHGLYLVEPHVALDLVTPRDNIASIDYERHVTNGSPLVAVILTGAVSAGFASIIGLGIHDRDPVPIAVGSVAFTAAAGFFALALACYIARDFHRAIAP